LHYAFYLGKTTARSQLLSADVASLPLQGPTSKVTIPFGNTFLTILATPAQRLGGTLSAWMWWLVAIFGVLASVAAALTTERLVRRRNTAESLRARVETLLGQQRGIAESLQRALLPQALPRLAGADVAARYVPGTDGTEVGGDWYDVLPQDDHRLFFVIGDVSGRGIRAAAVMASLRFAIRGFVSEGHPPAAVLASTAQLLDLRTDRHFATVLCGYADLRSGELTFASAGHLPPLLVTDEGAAMIDARVGPPIGVAAGVSYTAVTVALPRAGMLLFLTDGLVERRGEDLDQGLARLVQAVTADGAGPDVGQQLDALLATLLPAQASDDTAVVGVRWK
jgi:serine phosphatase RsbU (regulator of sigma subunit)